MLTGNNIALTFKRSMIVCMGTIAGFLIFNTIFYLKYSNFYNIGDALNSSTYGQKSILQFLLGIKNYFLISVYLLFLFIPVVFKKVYFKSNIILVFVAGALLFSVQLLLNQFSHYYIIILPFLILAGAMLMDTFYNDHIKIVTAVLIISFAVNEALLKPRITTYMISSLKSDAVERDQNVAFEINKLIPENSRVYLAENPERKFYYLCHFNSAIPKKYGFSFGNFIHRSAFIEILNESEYFIINKKYLGENTLTFIDTAITNLDQTLIDHNYKVLAVIEDYHLFKKL